MLGQKDQIEEELGIRTQADVNKIIYDLYLAYPELSDSDHSGSDYDVTLTGEAGN
ncbi:MAG UNVERIFIED_CONTAM: hypothetical protein LVQ98_04765 [Rickettsiaceae bacterium]